MIVTEISITSSKAYIFVVRLSASKFRIKSEVVSVRFVQTRYNS